MFQSLTLTYERLVLIVDTLVDTLKDATNSWLDQFKELGQHFELDAKAYGFEVKMKIGDPSLHPIRRLNHLLLKFQENCHPLHSGMEGKPLCLL